MAITAVRHNAGALSVGNILGSNIFGSNIFDILVPTRAAALIAELEVGSRSTLSFALPILAAVSSLALAPFSRQRGLQKWEAWILIAAYSSYDITKIAGA